MTPIDTEPKTQADTEVDASLAAHYIARFAATQVGDDIIVTARRWIDQGRVVDAVRSVAAALVVGDGALTDSLAIVAGDMLESSDLAQLLIDIGASSDPEIDLRHDYAPLDEASDAHLRDAVIDATREEASIATVWAARRIPPLGAAWPPRRLTVVVEAFVGSDVVRLAASIEERLHDAGQELALVEVRTIGDGLTTPESVVVDLAAPLWTVIEPGDFCIAEVFDGVDAGEGVFDSDHPILDEDQRARLVAQLESGAMLLAMSGALGDVWSGEPDRVVPINLRTDGRWIWSDASSYFLSQHGLAPDTRLLEHLRTCEQPVTPVDTLTLRRAMDAITPSDPSDVNETADEVGV